MRPRLHDKIPRSLRDLLCDAGMRSGYKAGMLIAPVEAALSRSYRRGYIAGHLAARRTHKRKPSARDRLEAEIHES